MGRTIYFHRIVQKYEEEIERLHKKIHNIELSIKDLCEECDNYQAELLEITKERDLLLSLDNEKDNQ